MNALYRGKKYNFISFDELWRFYGRLLQKKSITS